MNKLFTHCEAGFIWHTPNYYVQSIYGTYWYTLTIFVGIFRVKTQNNSMRSQLHRSIPWRQTNGSLMPGACAGQLRVLGSNVAGPTTWNSVVLVGQKTSSRKINKKRSVTSIYVSLPLHQALKAWHSSYYTSPWIQSMKAKKGVSTSEHLCQYDYIKNDQLVFEGLAKLLIETDTWAFHKWYVYKLQEVNQLGNSNECFFSKKYTNCKTKNNTGSQRKYPLTTFSNHHNSLYLDVLPSNNISLIAWQTKKYNICIYIYTL